MPPNVRRAFLLSSSISILSLALAVVLPGSLGAQTGPGGVDDVTDPENLVLWLRADAGVYADPGCLIPAGEGDPVACWADHSGLGHHGVQVLPAGRPAYLDGSPALNDRPVLRFNGAGNFIPTSAVPAINTQARTLFVVIQNGSDSGTPYQHILHYGSNGFVRAYGLCFSTSARQTQNGEGGIGNHYWALGFSSRLQPSRDAMLLRIQYDGRSDFLHANGRAQGGREVNLRTGQLDGIRVGSRIRTSSGREFFAGDIAEVIAFRTLLDPVKVLMIENYLSSKYDIPLALTDRYQGDEAESGDHDHDVAGIGRARDGQQLQAFSGGMGLRNRSFLIDSGDYILYGHQQPHNRVVTTDLPPAVPARFDRVWKLELFDEGVIEGGKVDVIFDFAAAGVGQMPSGNAFHLLQRAGTSGEFTSIATHDQISGQQIRFFEVDLPVVLDDGAYFTLGLTPNGNDVDIAVTLRQAGETAAGPRVDYALIVENQGLTTTVEGIEVVHALPDELYGARWTCRATAGSSCHPSLGLGDLRDTLDLAPGGRAVYAVNAALAQGSDGVVLAASVELPATLTDSDPSDNAFSLLLQPAADAVDLVAELDDGKVTASVGEELVYTLNLTNRGPAIASNARVRSDVALHLGPCTWSCSAQDGASCDEEIEPETELDEVVDIPPGAELIYSGRCRVIGPVRGVGRLLKSVTVTPRNGVDDRHPGDNVAVDLDLVLR